MGKKERSYFSIFETIQGAVPEFDFSFEEFKKAIKIVTSRTFSTGIDYPSAMAPVGDLFNHEVNLNSFWEFKKDEGLFISAYYDIKKGEQIFITYG